MIMAQVYISDTNKTDLKIKESQFVHFEMYGADTLEGNAVDFMYRGRIYNRPNNKPNCRRCL